MMPGIALGVGAGVLDFLNLRKCQHLNHPSTQHPAPSAPGKGISAKEAQDAVNQTLAGLGLDGVVSVNVEDNPGVLGFTTAPGVVPSGGSHNGKIYVFTDNISDVTEVFDVVLHELFHKGLSRSVKPGEYIDALLKFVDSPQLVPWDSNFL
ncbi:MAG: hypothetical protein ACOYB2_02495 [Limnohabitans sp.]